MNQKTLKFLMDGFVGVKDVEIALPKIPVAKGETVIDTLADDLDLHRLFTLGGKLMEDLDNRSTEIMDKTLTAMLAGFGDISSDEKGQICVLEAELGVKREIAKAVFTLFWVAVKDALDGEGKVKASQAGSIAIRENWQVVAIPKQMDSAKV